MHDMLSIALPRLPFTRAFVIHHGYGGSSMLSRSYSCQ